MKRLAYAAKITKGRENDLRKTLGGDWADIKAILAGANVTNFSIWTAADELFIYGEVQNIGQDEKVSLPENGLPRSLKAVLGDFDGILSWICAPGGQMKLMYHNFGVVRCDKSLIRHRMFMTILKDGCADEYYRRHSVLVEARGETVDPGPDSNFSIWSDGKYIFGYDEIDTTMETAETPESRESTIAWETKQLGIMDWVTDDVDWMTGERHAKSIRIAHYN